HVFDALRRSSGAVIVLHPRGEVHADGHVQGIRSSVWINQEVALFAYRQFFEKRSIPILMFRDPSVTLEGAMTSFIVNPELSIDEDTVLPEVRRWLQEVATKATRNEDDAFERKWNGLQPDDRFVLAALIAEGGHDIKERSLRQRLTQDHGFDSDRAALVL